MSLVKVGCVAAVSLLVFPSPVRADDTPAPDSAACKAAFEEADVLLHEEPVTKLLEARVKLRACASPTCRAWMVDDCSRSLRDVDARMPSVVFSATDTRGASLTDVIVRLDGEIVQERFDGHGIEVDPGERRFIFEMRDGRSIERIVTIKEGEKAQRVSVVFEAPSPAPVAPTPVAPAPRSSLRTLGWIGAGSGAAGLALGVAFGIKAMVHREDAACDTGGRCDAGPLADARSSATVATIAFVAGATLLAGGIAALFVSSRSPRTATHALAAW
jgi:hypothetical protein